MWIIWRCREMGMHLAYAVNAGGDYTLHLFDLESGATRRAPRISESPGVGGVVFLSV